MLSFASFIKIRKLVLRFLLMVTFATWYAPSARAVSSETIRSEHTQARLLSSTTGIIPGETFFVALHLVMDEGWHTYHKDPGDAGLATSIDWTLPEGVTAGEIIWPTPIQFETAGIASQGYEGEVYLRVPISVSDQFSSETPVTLEAAVMWLECADICIPGEATLALKMNINPQAALVQGAPWDEWHSLEEANDEMMPPMKNKGIVVFDDHTPTTIYAALVMAFLGGLILNLMPCVFPVLGIKILGFVNQSGEDERAIRAHGLVFTAGVLVSFWLLVSVLLVLREAGEQLGWGFQLQNPLFIAFLIIVFFLFSLNLLGVFEFGLSLTSVGSNLSNQNGLQGAFFSGALTTIVATPCTAPFMSGAIGFALNQPYLIAITIFTSIATGLATPYLLLSFFPKWIEYLPRPGAWMDTLKQFFAFPMLATVLWLLWVFGGQTGVNQVSMMLGTLILLSFSTWILGSFAHAGRTTLCRSIAYGVVIFLTFFGLSIAYKATQPDSPSTMAWEKFSMERVHHLRQEGKQVYIDFTAKWCTQCLSNKKLVFDSPGSAKVIETFEETNTVAMKADWTIRDPAITAALQSFGRAGVPFNVIYPADLEKDPIILPTILTQQIVIDALHLAKGE